MTKHSHKTIAVPGQKDTEHSTSKGSLLTCQQSHHTDLVKHSSRKSSCPVRSEQEQPPFSCISEQEEDALSQALGETLGGGDPLESDVADNHSSSPSEDFSSYVQMVSRMAKTLKMNTEQPPAPTEDLIFGDINQERSPPLSLNYIPALMDLIKEHWTQPATSLPVSR